MLLNPPRLLVSEPETSVLDRLAVLERGCLAVVLATVVVSVAEWLIPSASQVFSSGWRPISVETAGATLISVFSLHFAKESFGRKKHILSAVLALSVVLGSLILLAGHVVHGLWGIEARFPAGRGYLFDLLPARMSPQAAGGFALLGLCMVFLRARTRVTAVLADLLVSGLGLLILILVIGQVINSLSLFGPTIAIHTSHLTLLCLSLLTLMAFVERTHDGVFSIFLGRGLGSKIARGLAPVLLVLPLLREAVRAYLISSGRVPPHYMISVVASFAAVVSMAILIYLAWRLNSMEHEIHDLSLRDPLTGLYNLRGFRILAEQALLLAHRSGLPFSVLFIDLDNLKVTNDVLGHKAGSDFLVETANLLREAFRETDVLGRMGGDEFAVAGQFSETAIGHAAERLLAALDRRNTETQREIELSFSIGVVTSRAHRHQSLEELLARADEAMYEEKRRRKAALQ